MATQKGAGTKTMAVHLTAIRGGLGNSIRLASDLPRIVPHRGEE